MAPWASTTRLTAGCPAQQAPIWPGSPFPAAVTFRYTDLPALGRTRTTSAPEAASGGVDASPTTAWSSDRALATSLAVIAPVNSPPPTRCHAAGHRHTRWPGAVKESWI
jgi:hypothetical protein